MDYGPAIFLLFLLPLIVIGVTTLFRHHRRYEEAKEAWLAVYTTALYKLKKNPNSPELRAEVLRCGRALKKMAVADKDGNLFDDSRMSLDIQAACAEATIGAGNADKILLNTSNITPDGIAEEIKKLTELHRNGILSNDDLDIAKSYLLKCDKNEELSAKIRTLHELKKVGAVTENEYNMKKWDILSRR